MRSLVFSLLPSQCRRAESFQISPVFNPPAVRNAEAGAGGLPIANRRYSSRFKTCATVCRVAAAPGVTLSTALTRAPGGFFCIFLFAFSFHYPLVGITPLQFEQMKNRVRGRRRVAAPVLESTPRLGARAPQVILGIDPSLRGTGYGVIRAAKPQPQALAHGTISCPSGWEHSRCLVRIAEVLRGIIRQHHPTVCVVEGLFYAQNLQTALIMGEARGASLVAVAEAGLEIYELAPRKVKQAMVGYGAAQKLAVAKMVQRMLGLREMPASDAADALALALTHAQEAGRYTLTAPQKI